MTDLLTTNENVHVTINTHNHTNGHTHRHTSALYICLYISVHAWMNRHREGGQLIHHSSNLSHASNEKRGGETEWEISDANEGEERRAGGGVMEKEACAE